DAVGRSAHVLARAACVFLCAGARGARMRVLALDQYSDPGGAQYVLLEALDAFREAGWEARGGMPGEGTMFGRVAAVGFETCRLACGPYRSGAKGAADVVRFAWDAPRLAAQVRRAVREFRPDVIYVNGPRLLPGVALAATGMPAVFHAHSVVPA